MKSPVEPRRRANPGVTTRTILGAWGLFAAVLLVMLGNGMLVPLLGIRAELEGFSTTTTGLVLGFYYVGFLAGAWVTPRLVGQVGHIRVYAALASLASTATLIHILTPSAQIWSGARLVTGFSMSGLFIVAESWLNDAVDNESRGRLLAVYMVVLMGGLALGQMLITVADPAGIVLFVLASILVSVAVIPITLSTSAGPRLAISDKLPVGEVWRSAPMGLTAAFGQGVGVAALLSLAAVYASRTGMDVDRTAVFITTAIVGSIVCQGPIGLLSDRLGRRWMIMGVSLSSAAACLAMINIRPTSWWALAASFLVGGLTLPMYPLALSHISDRVPPGSAVGVSSVVSLVTGIGAVTGPIGAALSMEAGGPAGLFWFIGAVYAGIALFALLRLASGAGIEVKQRRAFAMVPARAGTVILHTARRIRRPGEGRRSSNDGAAPGRS